MEGVAGAGLPPTSAHPAFSNLFVETEYLHEVRGLLASRRPRKEGEVRPWAAHVVARGEGSSAISVEYETDRACFIGRGQGISNPRLIMMLPPIIEWLSRRRCSTSIFSLRVRIRIEPDEIVHLVFTTMAPLIRVKKSSVSRINITTASASARISALVWTCAQVRSQHTGHQSIMKPNCSSIWRAGSCSPICRRAPADV